MSQAENAGTATSGDVADQALAGGGAETGARPDEQAQPAGFAAADGDDPTPVEHGRRGRGRRC